MLEGLQWMNLFGVFFRFILLWVEVCYEFHLRIKLYVVSGLTTAEVAATMAPSGTSRQSNWHRTFQWGNDPSWHAARLFLRNSKRETSSTCPRTPTPCCSTWCPPLPSSCKPTVLSFIWTEQFCGVGCSTALGSERLLGSAAATHSFPKTRSYFVVVFYSLFI